MTVSAPQVAIPRFDDQAENRDQHPLAASRGPAKITVRPRRSQKFTGRLGRTRQVLPHAVAVKKSRIHSKGRWSWRHVHRSRSGRRTGPRLLGTGQNPVFSRRRCPYIERMGTSNLAASQILNGIFTSYRLLLGTDLGLGDGSAGLSGPPSGGLPPPIMKLGAAIWRAPWPANCLSRNAHRSQKVPDLSVRASCGSIGPVYRPSD